jgi:putative CocE/NonD family hydrolase
MSSVSERAMREPEHGFGESHHLYVTMSDGVRLKTHVWLPDGEGPWPAMFVRNPYVDGSDSGDPSLLQFVRYGYAVVLQECRGRGKSEGVWEPYANERQDGSDALRWLVSQPWQDGNIGLYGGSYLGFTQWIVADCLPPEVKTMYVCVMGTDLQRFAYMNGMFRHDIYTSWSLTNAGVDWAGRDMGEVAYEAYSYRPQAGMDLALLGRKLDWYNGFVTHPAPGDPYWEEGVPGMLKSIPAKVNVPVCLVGGWFDIALDTMFESFLGLREDIREKSRFVVGPWTHSIAPAGDLEYPNGWMDGTNGGTKAVLAWFDHTLKGMPYPVELGVVHAYTIGESAWQDWKKWPPQSRKKMLYLSGDSGLSEALSNTESARSASFIYDPNDPVVTVGSSCLLNVYGYEPYWPKNACVKQPEPGYRQDVISFVSEPLELPIRIAGNVSVTLYVGSTAEDTAFTVKLMEVFPNGEAYNIVDGITSLAFRNGATEPLGYAPGAIERIRIELWSIAWRVNSGSRIRLDVSSSNYPAYHAHPNVAGNWSLQENVREAWQTLYWGASFPSFVELPIDYA